ncbi:MAG: Spy/CpxP family protein refolding chaperone [Oligoflexus sp.]
MPRLAAIFFAIVMVCIMWGSSKLSADSNKDTDLVSPEVHSQLNLSDQQLAKIQELRKSQKRQVQAKEQALKTAQNEFRKALRKHAKDEELKKHFQALQEARAAVSEARFQQMLKLRGVLTDEQQKKFRGLKATRNEPN